jgi:hypothetical protein
MSTVNGEHADLDKLLEVIKCLPAGVELAIGGGNPMSHPDLLKFLYDLKKHGFIANITINQKHIKTYYKQLEILNNNKLINGVGISIYDVQEMFDVLQLKKLTNNIVYHLIVGVNTTAELDTLIALGNCKVLLLGFKQFGRGIKYYNGKVDCNITNWKIKLSSYLGKCVVSFDNLAIEQLQVKNIIKPEQWDQFYMGDDFVYTMYIDAVKQEFAPTSRSNGRVSFNDSTLLEYFKSKQIV